MKRVLSRREVLGGVAAGAAATVCGQRAAAIEPIRRRYGARFQYSLAAYSYRNLLSGADAEMDLEGFIDECARMGLEGTELTSYYFPEAITPEYLNRLKARAFRQGLDISGTAVRNDFCLPAGAARDQELSHVETWAGYAAAMGAPVVRIFSGRARDGQSIEDARALAIEGMEAASEKAGKVGVHLALENHGGLTTGVEGMLELVRGVSSEWFGVNLDTGNFHSDDVYGDLAKLAPYAVNVQVKVVVQGSDGTKEPTDYARLGRILRDTGYRGYVVLEYEEGEDPRMACPRHLDAMRDAMG